MFNGEDSFDTHVWTFIPINEEFSSLEQVLQEQKKVKKMIRSLPPSFDELEMETSVKKISFDELVTAVHANIERRKKTGI